MEHHYAHADMAYILAYDGRRAGGQSHGCGQTRVYASTEMKLMRTRTREWNIQISLFHCDS